MLYGKVVGHATSTVKHESMRGWKLLLVQPCAADPDRPGETRADGDPVLAVDSLGAGGGEHVMISSDGKYTAELVGTKATPVRWSVIGILDQRVGGSQ